MDQQALIELGKTAGALVAMAGLAALGWKALRGLFRTIRKLGHVADEVLGDPDKPGLFDRLKRIEARLGAVERRVGEVLGEVKPNGGSSMRDEVQRIARVTGADDEQ